MKRIIIFAVFLFVASFAKAQSSDTRKNFIGGYFSFLDEETNLEDNTQFNIGALVGTSINQHWKVGVLFSFKYNGNTNVPEKGVGAFSRYIFKPEKQLSFFAQPQVFYISARDKNIIDAGIAAGLHYDINKKWAAMLNFGGIEYVKETLKSSNPRFDDKTHRAFGFNFDLSTIVLGVELKF